MRRRKQRPFKRWFFAIAVLLAAAVGFGVWRKLPQITGTVLTNMAKKAGFESAALSVDRIGLDGIALTNVQLRSEGVEVGLSSVRVDYSPSKILSGSVARIQLDGLQVLLDFTRPRAGLLPDGLVALIGEGGGGGFHLPLDSFEALGGKLVIVLSEETHLFTIDVTGERQPDDQIGFAVKVDHPDQRLKLEGVATTETLDAAVSVTAVETRPELYLSIARQLGLFKMVDTITFDSGLVDAEGSVTVKNGKLASVLGSFHLPQISAVVDGTSFELTDIRVESGRDSTNLLTGSVKARLSALNTDAGWKTGPMLLDASLAADAVTGSVQDIVFVDPERLLEGAISRFEIAQPWSQEDVRVDAEAAISSLKMGDLQMDPFTALIEGGFDGITLKIAEMKFAEGPPFALKDVDARVDLPLLSEKAVLAEATVVFGPVSEPGELGDWRWENPNAKTLSLHSKFAGTVADGSMDGALEWTSEMPRIQLRKSEQTIAFSPDFVGKVVLSSNGVSAEATVEFRDVEQNVVSGEMDGSGLQLDWRLPLTSYQTLRGLTGREFEGLAFATGISSSVLDSEAAKRFSLDLQRSAESESWNAVLNVTAREETASVGGLSMSGVEFDNTIKTAQISDSQIFELVDSGSERRWVQEVAAGSTVDASFKAKSIAAPAEGLKMEWVSGTITKTEPNAASGLWGTEIAFDLGVVRAAGERVEQVHGDFRLSNGISSLDLVGRFGAIVEGSQLYLDLAEQVSLDWDAITFSANGVFSFPAFVVSNSDWVGRRYSQFAGMIIGGSASGHGNLRFDSSGDWDADAYVSMSEGSVNYPKGSLKVFGLEADLSIDSVRELTTAPGQAVRFKELSVGNLAISDGAAAFRLNGPDQIFVEGIGLGIFGGSIATGKFSLFLPDPDLAVNLVVTDVDLGQLVEHFELFDGEMTGRLTGRVPIGLLAGQLVFGEGFLRLDDKYPATLVYRTRGAFTRGLPSGSGWSAQINRLPYELLEEGLESLDVESVEVRLFNRAFPETPIRIEVRGRSLTDRADVPIILDNNINGSVAEVLDFLYRLFVL